jgi:tetratricopeptide (TPR) repeat protein
LDRIELDALYGEAKVFMSKKRYDKAVEIFDKVRQSGETNLDVNILLTMGIAYYYYSRHVEAVECFDKGVSIKPTCLGMMLPYLSYLSTTLSFIEKIIQIQPDFIDALYLRAWILHWLYEHADALTAVNFALEKDPNHKKSQELQREILEVLKHQSQQ